MNFIQLSGAYIEDPAAIDAAFFIVLTVLVGARLEEGICMVKPEYIYNLLKLRLRWFRNE